MTNRHFGHRAPLLWIVLPLMGGLAAGETGLAPPVATSLAVACGAAILSIPAAGRFPRLWMTAVCLAMLAAGSASYSLHRHRLPDWDGHPPREARLSLRVDRVFPSADPRHGSGLATVVRTEGHLRDLTGQRIYFSLGIRPPGQAPGTSAVIAATGLLTVVPASAPGSTFDGSLAALGVNLKLTRARLSALEARQNSFQRFSSRLAERMNLLLGDGLGRHHALAGIYRAMMLGQKRDLPEDQRRLFLHSGTMHLFAINGIHIAVVAAAIHALLGLLRCPRWAAAVLVLAILWLDVGATGTSPSAVRAWILVAALEAAWILRRPSNPLSALALAALIVLLADPMDFFSASFRMSYGVVTAIVAFGVPLAAALGEKFPPFRDLPEVTWSWRHHALAWIKRRLLQALGIGLAAALAGGVTGIQYFGVIVPGGLLANLLLMPPAMAVIVSGFASIVGGLAGVPAASRFFNHAAAALLWLITAAIGIFARVPAFWCGARYRADWIGPAALAALLAACLAGYGWRWRRDRGGFWAPFAIVAATIALGVRFG